MCPGESGSLVRDGSSYSRSFWFCASCGVAIEPHCRSSFRGSPPSCGVSLDPGSPWAARGWALVAVPEKAFALWDLGAWIVRRWPSIGWSPWLSALSASVLAALLALRFRISPFRACLTFGAIVVLVGSIVLF